jgi:dUTP pyrophosphatase
MAKLLVKRLSPTAVLPVKGTELAAGYDLHASVATVVPAQGRAPVKTDIAV